MVKDRAGQDVTINWKNADEIQIDITGTIKVRDGYYPNTVIANAKQSILAYIEKRVFGLESIIYATEFIIPVLQTDGVEAVIGIQIKKHDDEEFTDSVSLSREEVPEFFGAYKFNRAIAMISENGCAAEARTMIIKRPPRKGRLIKK